MSAIHRLGPFSLDLAARELRHGSQRIPLQPKVMALLRYLVEHADRTIPREELLSAVWPGVVVGDEALRRAISLLRRAIDGCRSAEPMLLTVRGRGYRLRVPGSPSEFRNEGGRA